MKLGPEIARLARAAAASGVLWGMIAGLACLVTTCLASMGEPYAHAMVAVAALSVGFLARAYGAPGAGGAFATAFAALVPIFILAGWHDANHTIVGGTGYGCGTGAVMRSAQLALVGALVAFALPLGLLSMRRPSPRRCARLPIGVLLSALAVVGGVLATIGAERLRSRPDLLTFRRSLAVHAVIEPVQVGGDCLLTRTGCSDVAFEDAEIRVARHCYVTNACRLAVDLKDGLGLRPPTLGYDPRGQVHILKDERTGVWALASRDDSYADRRATARLAAQEGKRSWSPAVSASSVRGAIAPDVEAVLFGAAGVILALLGAVGLRRHAKRAGGMARGVDAEVGADGWVSVAGEPAESRRLSCDAGDLPLGPVVIAHEAAVDSYRGAAAPPVTILAVGTKRDVLNALEASAGERAFILFVAALHLVAPLLAAALAGRVF